MWTRTLHEACCAVRRGADGVSGHLTWLAALLLPRNSRPSAGCTELRSTWRGDPSSFREFRRDAQRDPRLAEAPQPPQPRPRPLPVVFRFLERTRHMLVALIGQVIARERETEGNAQRCADSPCSCVAAPPPLPSPPRPLHPPADAGCRLPTSVKLRPRTGQVATGALVLVREAAPLSLRCCRYRQPDVFRFQESAGPVLCSPRRTLLYRRATEAPPRPLPSSLRPARLGGPRAVPRSQAQAAGQDGTRRVVMCRRYLLPGKSRTRDANTGRPVLPRLSHRRCLRPVTALRRPATPTASEDTSPPSPLARAPLAAPLPARRWPGRTQPAAVSLSNGPVACGWAAVRRCGRRSSRVSAVCSVV